MIAKMLTDQTSLLSKKTRDDKDDDINYGDAIDHADDDNDDAERTI